MVVQGILDGFFNLYGISHEITFQYLQKIANANGYQLKRPLNTRKVLYKRYLSGGYVDTLQSLISLVFVFLAFIVNTKTIQSYSKSRLLELKNTKKLEQEINKIFNSTDSQQVIQNFLINSRRKDDKKVYFLEDKPISAFTNLDTVKEEDPVLLNTFESIQSISPLPSNPQNSPSFELLTKTNDSFTFIDLPQLTEIDLQSLQQSILSTVFPIASDESESENEVELETSTTISNQNILEVAFKSAGEIINQVSEPISTIEEKTLQNVLEQVNIYNKQSIVQRNIERIENEIKRQLELQNMQNIQNKKPKNLKMQGGQINQRKRKCKSTIKYSKI
jgi:hypothetical protein